jgi:hypothetical protein
MPREVHKHLVKPLDLLIYRRQRRGAILPADKKGARIPEHAGHMPDKLCRGADAFHYLEPTEIGGSVPQGFLRPVGERRQEVFLAVHICRSSGSA